VHGLLQLWNNKHYQLMQKKINNQLFTTILCAPCSEDSISKRNGTMEALYIVGKYV
jgi:hypothetical protein